MTYRMNHYDADELALTVCGLIDSDEAQEDPTDVADRAVCDRYDCDMDTFTRIAQDLLPLATIAPGALSGKLYQGFAKDGCFIVKQEIEREATQPRKAGEE